MGYCSYVSNDRRGETASPTTLDQAACRPEIATLNVPNEDVMVRDLLVSGGLRGLTVAQMFPERAA